MAKTPEEIIRAEVRALSAYHVPDPGGMVKLDAMENPYRLPHELCAAISARVTGAALNRYPDPGARELKAMLRTAMQIPSDAQLVLGNGSDELIQMLALAVAKPGAVMLGLEPSFVMFGLIAAFTGMRYVGVPLNADFSVAAARTLAAVDEHQPALIFIAYPNNPSGNLFDSGVVGRIIDAAPGIVVVDEAYHAFAGRSFMPRLAEFSNLLVMRTVSKLGLAGLRLGVLAGREGWLQHIDKVRLPYNVNVLTQLVTIEVLRERNVLEAQAAAIRAERARVLTELRRLPGVEAYNSDANFILFRAARADQLFNGLKLRGVLIKNLNGTHPLLVDCLRVTVGTPDENAQFLGALGALLNP
ncbi:MAG TPA: histidinol-phosphate transaminase [Burkholderiales bacterium]|nr:histidinol-phosphate transaminase [Burkholderiales bacterium]